MTLQPMLLVLALIGLSACGQGEVSQSVADEITAGIEAGDTEEETDTEDSNN